jgi:N-acyl-D-aspartate/D-glutamate deacylase
MRRRAFILVTFGCTLACTLACAPPRSAADHLDLLIRNARIVDGTGNPWFRGDIAVRGDQIVAVGRLGQRDATRTIDAADRVVAPGFIDMMAGSAVPLLVDSVSAASKLYQGVTTILVGEGDTDAPQGGEMRPDSITIGGRRATWRSFGDYLALLDSHRLGLNIVQDVGATQVRREVIGELDRRPTPQQVTAMQRLIEEAMRAGSVGVSSALIYPPATYASTDELIALTKASSPFGGTYFTHMRNEGNDLLPAIREAIRIGVGGGVPVHIYHLKAAGKENWGLMSKAIVLIDSARAVGISVTADFYPYIRNGISLTSFLDPHHYAEGSEQFLKTLSDPKIRRALRHEVETDTSWENWYRHVGSNWDKVLITGVAKGVDTNFVGLSIAGVAKRRGVDEWTAFFDLLPQGVIEVAPESMDEAQKVLALKAPFVAIDNDQPPTDPTRVRSSHPRAFGTFPRILALYVREEHVISLEEAVRKMTSLPANILSLHNRGRIAPGMAADLVMFDPMKVQDRATYEKPLVYSTGIDLVVINGKIALDGGRVADLGAGRLLRHPLPKPTAIPVA